MMKQPAIWIGGALAVILLALYSGTVVVIACQVVAHEVFGSEEATGQETVPEGAASPSTIETRESVPISQGTEAVIAVVGGLISALVVSRLAVTPPDESVGEFAARNVEGKDAKGWSYFVVYVYLGAWTVSGLTALVVGGMIFDDANTTLTNIGQTWLGTAVAAVYAYFGLQAPPPPAPGTLGRPAQGRGEEVPAEALEVETVPAGQATNGTLRVVDGDVATTPGATAAFGAETTGVTG